MHKVLLVLMVYLQLMSAAQQEHLVLVLVVQCGTVMVLFTKDVLEMDNLLIQFLDYNYDLLVAVVVSQDVVHALQQIQQVTEQVVQEVLLLVYVLLMELGEDLGLLK